MFLRAQFQFYCTMIQLLPASHWGMWGPTPLGITAQGGGCVIISSLEQISKLNTDALDNCPFLLSSYCPLTHIDLSAHDEKNTFAFLCLWHHGWQCCNTDYWSDLHHKYVTRMRILNQKRTKLLFTCRVLTEIFLPGVIQGQYSDITLKLLFFGWFE